MGCRNTHNFLDHQPGLTEMYKKWVPKGQLRAETEMDLSGPSAKKMKLDDATDIKSQIVLSTIQYYIVEYDHKTE